MKITKLFLLSMTVLLFSCSEDETPLPTSEGMIGTWNVTAIDYRGTTNTTYEGQTGKSSFIGKGKEMFHTTTFTADPNTVVSEGGYIIELKTTINGHSNTQDYEFAEAFMDGSWELDGKTLIITNDGVVQEGTITKQTETALEVRVKTDETVTDSEFTITTKINVLYKFEKVNP